jgi:hypothetical protein
VGEHLVDIEGVTSSILVTTTIFILLEVKFYLETICIYFKKEWETLMYNNEDQLHNHQYQQLHYK